jgi:PBP1b-binding outer membrane lipoprotein LpoB
MMKKTRILFCLCGTALILTTCVNYSGEVLTKYPDVYDTVDTSPIPNAPTLKQQENADRIEGLREVLFDMPIDHSPEW